MYLQLDINTPVYICNDIQNVYFFHVKVSTSALQINVNPTEAGSS